MIRRWLGQFTGWVMKDLAGAEDMAAKTRRSAARSWRNAHNHVFVLFRLAARRLDAGRPQDALETLEEAVELCRRWVAGEPARLERNLATALYKRSLMWEMLGRHEEALGDAEEAAELYQILLPRDPDLFGPLYADALRQLSDCLAHCDRHDEALPVAEHAVGIERRLAADLPKAREPALVLALISLSGLHHLRRPEDGVPHAAEAVRIARQDWLPTTPIRTGLILPERCTTWAHACTKRGDTRMH
jgi:tetratricopeptide (TPR) repeat protein